MSVGLERPEGFPDQCGNCRSHDLVTTRGMGTKGAQGARMHILLACRNPACNSLYINGAWTVQRPTPKPK